MDIITFESKAYHDLLEKIEKILEFVENQALLSSKNSEDIWLDGHDVCELLHISSRTLIRLRKDKTIPYTLLRGKCIYRLSDIEKEFSTHLINNDVNTLADFKRNYLLLLNKKRK